MRLHDFVVICVNNNLTLDEGYELYQFYRRGVKGTPKLSSESILKVVKNGIYKNGDISKKLKDLFADAEKSFNQGEEFEKTLELQGRSQRITSPVRMREMQEYPLLDAVIDSLETVLTDYPQGDTEKNIEKKAAKWFNDDPKLVQYFVVWLHLFPTNGKQNPKNSGWEKIFYTSYDGVRLRIGAEGHIKEFKHFARKYDMRVFVVGTYLFIRSRIRNGKTFIPKITNFYKEADEWYMTALDTIKDLGDKLPVIFDKDYMGDYVDSSEEGGVLI